MKTPIFIREMTNNEREKLKAGLHSKDVFVVRRSQILLSNARGETAWRIARNLGCDDQTVRNIIKGFNVKGLEVLKAGSRRPHKTLAAFGAESVEKLKDILHQSPRKFGKGLNPTIMLLPLPRRVHPYGWTVWENSIDGGFGVAFYYDPVAFSNSGLMPSQFLSIPTLRNFVTSREIFTSGSRRKTTRWLDDRCWPAPAKRPVRPVGRA